MTPDPDEDLPDGWVREFEGRHGAEFFHGDRNLAVQVLPRYDPPGGRASESAPDHYVVRLHRPYTDRPGIPIEIASVDDLPAALDTAREFVRGFAASDGSRRRATVEALATVGGYSDDRLRELLVDRTRDRVRAIVHAGPGWIDPVYGVEAAEDPIVGVPAGDLCELFLTAGQRLGDDLATDVEGSVVVTAGATLLWVPTGDGRGTLVAVDADATVPVPDLLGECATLLAVRAGE